MSERKFEQKAKDFFSEAKNSTVHAVYVTSDGNLFRAKHYADDWKTKLVQQELEIYSRSEFQPQKPLLGVLKEGLNPDVKIIEPTTVDGDAEREALVKEHIELFDTKPVANISIATLKAKIEAKKAELTETES